MTTDQPACDDESARWDYVNSLDEGLMRGGVLLSEWTSFIVRDADVAFCSGAFLSTLLTAMAAIESHLRFETQSSTKTLYELIEAEIENDQQRATLHELRRARNCWVHVDDPQNDQLLLDDPVGTEAALQNFAHIAIEQMRRVLYSHPCV